MNRIAGVILFCGVVCVASAQTAAQPQRGDGSKIWTPQPLLKFDDVLPEATVPKQMITSLTVSDVTVTLDDTELQAMQARFGGEIGSEGDAAESLGWLCLHGNDAPDRGCCGLRVARWMARASAHSNGVGSLPIQSSMNAVRRCQRQEAMSNCRSTCV